MPGFQSFVWNEYHSRALVGGARATEHCPPSDMCGRTHSQSGLRLTREGEGRAGNGQLSLPGARARMHLIVQEPIRFERATVNFTAHAEAAISLRSLEWLDVCVDLSNRHRYCTLSYGAFRRNCSDIVSRPPTLNCYGHLS